MWYLLQAHRPAIEAQLCMRAAITIKQVMQQSTLRFEGSLACPLAVLW